MQKIMFIEVLILSLRMEFIWDSVDVFLHDRAMQVSIHYFSSNKRNHNNVILVYVSLDM